MLRKHMKECTYSSKHLQPSAFTYAGEMVISTKYAILSALLETHVLTYVRVLTA
jgi:hypothetical protein